LRGDESDGDQALVEARSAELGVRMFVKRFDTESYAQEHGISIEMAARELRYAWFEDLCREYGFDVLAVAHNANDNAETLMLNLLRGTGLNGLHGMSEISELCATGKVPEDGEDMPPPARGCLSVARTGVFGISGTLPVAVCRPLLEFTRRQIEGYVLTNRVPYRHDSSNFESDYKRNRIRNEVFPVFAQINPSFVRTLNREIGYFTEAGSIVDEWCRTQLPNVLVASSDVVISTAKLLATKHWRYLLYYILEQYGFNSQTIASVEDLLVSNRTVSGKRFESPTHMLLTTRDTLMVQLLDKCTHSDEIMVVRGAGIYNFNGARFSVEVLERTPDMPLKQMAGTLILDADTLQLPFVCRRWRQGDWFIPLGMRGKKKVSDLFADLKFNALQKDASIIIVDTLTPDLAEQQHIAALLGRRIDDRYKVTPSTRTVLRITVR
jgi:tRNA(Ile)-lysidine synthase